MGDSRATGDSLSCEKTSGQTASVVGRASLVDHGIPRQQLGQELAGCEQVPAPASVVRRLDLRGRWSTMRPQRSHRGLVDGCVWGRDRYAGQRVDLASEVLVARDRDSQVARPSMFRENVRSLA